jgi:mannose-6-phosphate isomerase-like protein (cupin superfamily)
LRRRRDSSLNARQEDKSMKQLTLALVIAAVMSPVRAADNAGFALWKAAELQRRNVALSQKIGADHSARETLADYTNHRFRLLRRDGDGFPEQHDNIVDVVVVQSGEGTLVLGGEMMGRKATGAAGEYVGTSLTGGERHILGAGDVMHIPPKIPHAFLVPAGKHLTYVLVKFPAPR